MHAGYCCGRQRKSGGAWRRAGGCREGRQKARTKNETTPHPQADTHTLSMPPLLRRRGIALLLLAALAVAASAAADVGDGPEAQAAVGAPATAPAPLTAPSASTDAARAARDAVVNVEAVRSVSLDGDPRGSLDTNGFVVATTPGGKGIVATDHFGSAARASPALYTLRFADGGSVPVSWWVGVGVG